MGRQSSIYSSIGLPCVIEVISEFEQGNEHPCDAPPCEAMDHNGAGASRAVIQSSLESFPKNVDLLIVSSRSHWRNLDDVPDEFSIFKQAQFPRKEDDEKKMKMNKFHVHQCQAQIEIWCSPDIHLTLTWTSPDHWIMDHHLTFPWPLPDH